MKKTMYEELKDGSVLFGLGSNYPAPGIVEAMCPSWDFVWIDGQHGQHTYDSVLGCMQAARALGINSVIRVPGHDGFLIGRYLDLAPSAIMLPMVNNCEEAEEIIKHAQFPPKGQRSYGGRTAIDLSGREFHNEKTIIIAQIETETGLNHLDGIAAIDGIDVLFFGPDDMKLSLGIPINAKVYEDNLLLNAARKVAAAARKADKFCGAVATDEKTRSLLIDMGYQVIVAGADSGFIRLPSQQLINAIRKSCAHNL